MEAHDFFYINVLGGETQVILSVLAKDLADLTREQDASEYLSMTTPALWAS
jgi:hypothetical protein